MTVRPAAETLVGTPALLLSGQADLRAEFDRHRRRGGRRPRLEPAVAEGPKSDFRELRVGIAGGELRRMILVDRLGQTTRLDFDRIERNPRLDPAGFRFSPPPGVDVIGRAPADGA